MRQVNLEAAIEFLEGRAASAMEDLNNDFVRSMEWGGHEEVYQYKVQILFLREQIGKDRSVEAVKAEIAALVYRLVETSIHQNVLSTRCNQLKLAALKDLANKLHRYAE